MLLLFLLGSFLCRFLFRSHLKNLLEEFDSDRPFSNQLTQELDALTGYIQDIEVAAFILSTEFGIIAKFFLASDGKTKQGISAMRDLGFALISAAFAAQWF